MKSRPQAEKDLAKALSRHIGYTAGAFDLDRLSEMAGAIDKPSVYGFELVKAIQARVRPGQADVVSDEYAADIVNFCAAMGLIQRLPNAGSSKLTKYSLSSEALILRATIALSISGLRELVLVALLLENDADGYGLMLDLLDSARNDDERRGHHLAERYLHHTKGLRSGRFGWLKTILPHEVLLRRVAVDVPWLRVPERGAIQLTEPLKDFGRHHSAPRNGWCVSLGHADSESRRLTDRGAELLRRIRAGQSAYSWIGPSVDTIEQLKIPLEVMWPGPLAPVKNLLRPEDTKEVEDIPTHLVQEFVHFMHSAFPHLKLTHANQAPTSPLEYFLLLKEREVGYRISMNTLLERVFKENSDYFAPLSSRSSKMAYYLVRRKA